MIFQKKDLYPDYADLGIWLDRVDEYNLQLGRYKIHAKSSNWKEDLPSMFAKFVLTSLSFCRTELLRCVSGGQSKSCSSDKPTTTGCSACNTGFLPDNPIACRTFSRPGTAAGSPVINRLRAVRTAACEPTQHQLLGPVHATRDWGQEYYKAVNRLQSVATLSAWSAEFIKLSRMNSPLKIPSAALLRPNISVAFTACSARFNLSKWVAASAMSAAWGDVFQNIEARRKRACISPEFWK